MNKFKMFIAIILLILNSAPDTICKNILFTLKTDSVANNPIRTPKPADAPKINGPSLFGVRPGSQLLYKIAATGKKPLEYSAAGIPAGVKIDSKTGRLFGVIKKRGEYKLTFKVKNSIGTAEKKFKIIVGDNISLTPALGWNSWNCWGGKVTGENIMQSARAMVSSGLIDHGWTYINIDDAWQGKRGGKFNAIQSNEKFPDMKKMCETIHEMGLKVGIYSTPWTTSYATYIGGSSENAEGLWSKPTIPKKGNVNNKTLPWAIGKYHFAKKDALQWAEWGIDYLKYDWNPNEAPETLEMLNALKSSGRDVIYSLSNNTPYENISDISKLANSWRTTGDIRDRWNSMARIGFSQDKWAAYASPGHWNDPDMLVVGFVGWGNPRPTLLTPDEQYTHITLWCLLSAPLLIGCDMEKLDDFTLNLLTNDEVLAVDQDPLGKQAVSVTADTTKRVYIKQLEDGSKAVGLFNLGEKETTVSVRWSDLHISGVQCVRDLWRQKDLGEFDSQFSITVAPHGAEMVKIFKKTKK